MKGTRPRAVPWGLALGSAVLTYLLLEFVAFPLLLPYLPLKIHGHVAEEVRVFTQSSKRSTAPQSYVALLGDSFAVGLGDWLLGTNPWLNGAFHSAHVIQRETGRDVISFGQAGAGSLTGLVSAPIGSLRLVQAAGLRPVKAPQTIVVYFYPGNDFNNNLRDLQLRFHTNFAGRDVRDRELFRSFLTTVVLARDQRWMKAERGLRPVERLFFLRLVASLARRPLAPFPLSPITAGTNRLMVAGESVTVPYQLQAPGLELDDREIALGAYVFEEALRYLMERFPGVPVRVAYVPTPLECYEIAAPEVDMQTYEGRRARYRVEELERHHGLAVTAIREATERNGAVFLDVTPDVRRASRGEMLHGPRDWKHFNRAGYEVLGRAVAKAL